MITSNESPDYRQCSITVMDNIADPDIIFDENGVCNYYHEYKAAEKEGVLKGEEGEKKLRQLAEKNKDRWKGETV